ncbi:MAG: leucyl aminopeptidase [Rhodospirillales bacterium]|nr:leucyl aminopeptidase [Rhodospirillales bacterium]
MNVTFSPPALPDTGVLVVGVLDGLVLTPSARKLDNRMDGALVRAMEVSRFKGKKDQTLSLVTPAGSRLDRIVLLGLGEAKTLDASTAQALGGSLYVAVSGNGHDMATVAVDALDACPLSPSEIAAHMATGARLRSYRFDKYRTKEKPEEKPTLTALTFECEAHTGARDLYKTLDKVTDGVFLTRDVVSEPSNIVYPETLAAHAQALSKLGVEVEVLGEKEMRKLGMGALLGVGQGSARESQLVVMQWNGAGAGAAKTKGKGKKEGKAAKDAPAPIAFVGKGVTFDTGGISIKPSAGMEEMKYDMAGAGAVIGLMKALAGRKAKVNAIGVVGLVENMPSGTAQRPGDIVSSMSGQTIEVINTDAEGRLVLADALWYTRDRFKPQFMINLATLTGAIVIALGNSRAGLFSNNDELAGRIAVAADAVNEPVWRLPLGEEYDKAIKSDAADMKNVGNRAAGSITAAQFLQRFVEDTPWAHIDIAGVAWTKEPKPVTPKGATGYGVKLLDRLVADHYETKK